MRETITICLLQQILDHGSSFANATLTDNDGKTVGEYGFLQKITAENAIMQV